MYWPEITKYYDENNFKAHQTITDKPPMIEIFIAKSVGGYLSCSTCSTWVTEIFFYEPSKWKQPEIWLTMILQKIG